MSEITNLSAEEIVRIIILTILHTSRQHYHCQLVVHGQDSLRRGNTVYGNELAIFFFDVICSILCLLVECNNLSSYVQIKIVVICYVL